MSAVGASAGASDNRRLRLAAGTGVDPHVRAFDTCGADRDRGRFDRFQRRRVVPTFIQQALAGERITVHGDGTRTRSLCYVEDLIEGLFRLVVSDETGPVNVGNPSEIMWRSSRAGSSTSPAAALTSGMSSGRSTIQTSVARTSPSREPRWHGSPVVDLDEGSAGRSRGPGPPGSDATSLDPTAPVAPHIRT
jgi:hypothetical protein